MLPPTFLIWSKLRTTSAYSDGPAANGTDSISRVLAPKTVISNYNRWISPGLSGIHNLPRRYRVDGVIRVWWNAPHVSESKLLICSLSRFCSFCESRSKMLLTSLLLLFLFSPSAVLGADDYRTCYYPSGFKALGHTPCSDDEHTACCDNNHVCMTNGLCVNVGSNQPYGFSRAACTDKSWGSSCPQECIKSKSYPAFAIPQAGGRTQLTTTFVTPIQERKIAKQDAQF